MNTTLLLQLCCGLGWALVYVEIIRIGFKQRTYGMPFFALILNLSWEIIATILSFTQPQGVDLQGYLNLVWCLFDLVILYTYFAYGYRYFPDRFGRQGFVTWSLASLVGVLLITVGFVDQFAGIPGAVTPNIGLEYHAALSNVLMSVLFIDMFVRRGGLEGQSITIAVSKFVGTFSIWLLLRRDLLINYIGPPCFMFDVIYLILVIQATLAKSSLLPEVDGSMT